mmetsp:Transcript_23432/g.58629  ORF Transcript_23432/g.58629 Transcript_23432/m.58629 type:complete len:479 (-) Transcript_23432:185-1621(-)|eukprot:CAMPEP_0177661974 /NCGR_PEP_ID=MMETSP0447-20121125/19014_1 /TAXON_ID=0 /ORGANISM="Stygamoeba regulata, Strain BSH-02190019" /LENGTH=478 /DNA_ID=CAMNT_0019167451 /DNA_START=62 /DNA_END=1498 /DNA_ORIENTATION=+
MDESTLLSIKVVEARNLAAKDFSGYSDPYCILNVCGHSFKTAVVKKNLNPTWNQTFKVDAASGHGSLEIELWDEDIFTPDDFLGQVEISIREIVHNCLYASDSVNHTVSRWYPLEKRAAKPKEVVTGEVHLEFSMPNAPQSRALAETKVTCDDFEILKVLGQGSFGKVVQVRKKSNGKIYAMKILSKANIVQRGEVTHTMAERSVLGTSDHPFLVRLHFAFQTDTKLYLVLDYVNGGELFFHLQHERRFDENRVRFYIAEIVLAIEHLHTRAILYRDLKPENILLENTGHIRLTDFGLAKEMGNDDTTYTLCGTAEYFAPELLHGKGYGNEADLWSIGILMFEMLTGRPPFQDKVRSAMFNKIKTAELRFPNHVSPVAADLIEKLLVKNPKQRATIEQVKRHPFFQSIDWKKLRNKEVAPPFIPSVTSEADTSQFDTYFTGQRVDESLPGTTTLPQEDQNQFTGFSFINPSQMQQPPQ